MINDIQFALKELQTTNMSASLFFLLREQREEIKYSVLRTRIVNEIAMEFKDIFIETLEKICHEPDLEFMEYEPLFMAVNSVIETIPIDMIPYCREIIAEMDAPYLLDYPVKIDEDFIHKLWAYGVKLSDGNNSYYYFRKYWRRNVLQSGGRLRFFFDKGTFSRLESDVFSFDGKIDSIVLGSNMLILQKNLFEQIFRYLEHYKKIADDILESLRQSDMIYGFQELAGACESDFRKMKKLAGISNNIDLSALSFDDLRDVARDFRLELKFDERTRKIFIEKKQEVWTFLKLIGDDLLKSPLTRNKYEAQYKKRYR